MIMGDNDLRILIYQSADITLQKSRKKLAAMVNKFLMRLANAIGFSFSLLVCGSSPELGKLIDVYR